MISLADKNQTEPCKYCKQQFPIKDMFAHIERCDKKPQPQKIELNQNEQNPQPQQKQQQQPNVQPQKKKMNIIGPVEVIVEGKQDPQPTTTNERKPVFAQPTQRANQVIINTKRCAYCDEVFELGQFDNHLNNCDAKKRTEILLQDYELIDTYQVAGSGVINTNVDQSQSENGKIVAKYLQLCEQHQEIMQGMQLMHNAKWSSTDFNQGMIEEKCGKCHQSFSQQDQIYVLDCLHKYHKQCIFEKIKTSSKCHCGFELFN